jgi:putative transposase
MTKTFKYRLQGNKETFANAEKWLLLCQKLYNAALQQRIICYRERRETLSFFDQQNQLPELRREFPEYKSIGSQVLCDVVERLDKAYKDFFRRVNNRSGKVGFPRFRSRDRYDSFTIRQAGWKLDGKYLTIRNVGRFKLRLSRPIQGEIKTITIRRQSDKWYACFLCNNVSGRKLEPCDKSVGIDVGIKSFCVDSDKNTFESPKYFRQSERLLRVRQRKLARCKKGGNRRKLVKSIVSKTYEKITNQRNDFLHKVANHYITNYGVIYIEGLNINGMVRNHHLAKSISDSSWGKFFEFLKYKAEEAGTREIIKINRFEPSSKTCSVCGLINDNLKLSDRAWICLGCGTLHNRDYNAAKNIKRVGQTQQMLTCENTQSVVCESQQLESAKGSGRPKFNDRSE